MSGLPFFRNPPSSHDDYFLASATGAALGGCLSPTGLLLGCRPQTCLTHTVALGLPQVYLQCCVRVTHRVASGLQAELPIGLPIGCLGLHVELPIGLPQVCK
jgi:hypothetical protein